MVVVCDRRRCTRHAERAGGIAYLVASPVCGKRYQTGWMIVARPSRRPLCGLLRMRFFLNVIRNLPHPEERPKGASRRTRDLHADAPSRLFINDTEVVAT